MSIVFVLYGLLIYSILYFIFIFLLIIGIGKLKKGENKKNHSVSIIIPARNEEDNISECLACLKYIDYPKDKWEVIVIDDSSEDFTFQKAESFKKEIPNIQIIRIEKENDSISPKKNAILTGIKQSKGEIIVATDADCRPNKEWISEIISHFDANTGLVAGFSPIISYENPDKLLNSFQFIESISLGGLSSGSIELGFPLTCTGRNLAYRKEIFNNIGGFGEYKVYISGDDDLFMHRIKKKSQMKIKYAPKSTVISKPTVSLKEFFNNRLRHSSKFVAYPFHVKIVSIFLYLFNALIIISLLCVLFNPSYLWLFIISLLIKYFSDISLIKKTKKKFYIKEPIKKFIIVFFLHPLYITIFGLLGLRGKFKWKNRVYKTKC
jgi:cellulose synthase/poly-beta-1,6-N-acetylglucosamine synthase-like glycosyltransferase